MADVRMIEIEALGGSMPVFVATPSGEARAAVIVLMEAFGLVDNLKLEAQRIADMGYLAVVPDVYYRMAPDNKAGYDDLESALGLMGRLDDAEFISDMRATLDYLRAQPSMESASVGVTGFCMGGRLSFLMAAELPGQVAACAPFYGGGIGALLDRADRISCPLHLFFGGQDPFIPQAEVEQIDAKLGSLGKTYALENYAGADHGFCCAERPSYNEAAASDAWAKLEIFFRRNL